MPDASDANTRQCVVIAAICSRTWCWEEEIKCRRRKRQVVIPLESKPSDTQQNGSSTAQVTNCEVTRWWYEVRW